MWPILGAALALYATWSIGRGAICVRDGWWWRDLARDERPRTFWTTVAVCYALALLLLFLA